MHRQRSTLLAVPVLSQDATQETSRSVLGSEMDRKGLGCVLDFTVQGVGEQVRCYRRLPWVQSQQIWAIGSDRQRRGQTLLVDGCCLDESTVGLSLSGPCLVGIDAVCLFCAVGCAELSDSGSALQFWWLRCLIRR